MTHKTSLYCILVCFLHLLPVRLMDASTSNQSYLGQPGPANITHSEMWKGSPASSKCVHRLYFQTRSAVSISFQQTLSAYSTLRLCLWTEPPWSGWRTLAPQSRRQAAWGALCLSVPGVQLGCVTSHVGRNRQNTIGHRAAKDVLDSKSSSRTLLPLSWPRVKTRHPDVCRGSYSFSCPE